MHLLRALAELGPVDLMLIHRDGDRDAEQNQMRAAAEVARSIGKISLRDWSGSGTRWPRLSHRQRLVADTITPYCAEAPRLARATLQSLADALPQAQYDLVFAGRLPCAAIAEALIRRGLLSATRKVVDFDDIMSRVGMRQLVVDGAREGSLWRLTKRLDCGRIHAAERRILNDWDVTSVCTEDDVRLLQSREPRAGVVRVPNIVDKPRLPVTSAPYPRLLFVGSLAHGPNVQGLRLFLDQAWPIVRAALPDARLRIVGMWPFRELREEAAAAGAELHVDVPSVEPYYRDCDFVISPIFFGGGTRIKVLEAMSYGRPIVSSTIGAEGLDIVPERHALIADSMAKMAAACIRLSRDAGLRTRLADAAFELQRRAFGPNALRNAVREMVVTHAGAEPHKLARMI